MQLALPARIRSFAIGGWLEEQVASSLRTPGAWNRSIFDDIGEGLRWSAMSAGFAAKPGVEKKEQS